LHATTDALFLESPDPKDTEPWFCGVSWRRGVRLDVGEVAAVGNEPGARMVFVGLHVQPAVRSNTEDDEGAEIDGSFNLDRGHMPKRSAPAVHSAMMGVCREL
jgi:hypothetical protein